MTQAMMGKRSKVALGFAALLAVLLAWWLVRVGLNLLNVAMAVPLLESPAQAAALSRYSEQGGVSVETERLVAVRCAWRYVDGPKRGKRCRKTTRAPSGLCSAHEALWSELRR